MPRGQRPAHRTTGVLKTPQGDVVQISLARFLNEILPPLRHNFNPAQVVNTLLHSNSWSSSQKPITSKGRWRGFSEDPTESRCHENESFRYLKRAVHAISKAGGSESTPASFYCNPTCLMAGETQRAESLPDAYFSLGRTRSWTDITSFGELKKNGKREDAEDNIAKITGNMALCLHHDPRRRFLYAFTIENTSMRFWFCDRSQILASESFNFITEHEPMVHFFLSIMYAEPAEYGLDPTMMSLDGGQRYEMNVHCGNGRTRVYRTMALLSSGDPATVRGKGTHVWKVIEIEDEVEIGEPMVLKDSWVDPERTPEGTIFENVRLADRPEDYQRCVAAPFLTVECHGDVYLGNDHRQVLDCTRPSGQLAFITDIPVKSRDELASPAAMRGAPATDQSMCKRLVHYRIVFREVCTRTLDKETSLVTIFRALAQAALALRDMHVAGWVHRDVSAGNILLKDQEHALLGDFEYAKKMGQDLDEFRIGTAYFIAVEVDAQGYRCELVIPPPTPMKERYPEMQERFDRRDAELRAAKEARKRPGYWKELIATKVERKRPPPFRYNPLHDLESLWWIAVYFLVKKEAVDGSAASTTGSASDFIASDAQRAYAVELFRTRDRRLATILQGKDFQMGVQSLPDRLANMADGLDFLRAEMFYRYFPEEIELDSITSNCANGMHEIFHDTFQEMANLEEIQGLTVRPFTYVPEPIDEEAYVPSDVDSKGCTIPSPYRIKRCLWDPPSDESFVVDPEVQVKRARLLDSLHAGVHDRHRPYLSRKAKRRKVRT